MDYGKLDEAMLPFHSYISSLAAFDGTRSHEGIHGFRMGIEQLQIETPFEVEIRVAENGSVTIGSTPPLYHVATGIEPVFHYMRVTIESIKTEEAARNGE